MAVLVTAVWGIMAMASDIIMKKQELDEVSGLEPIKVEDSLED